MAYLEHANLFITPLDDQHHWYHYHPLFADLLRHRLQQTCPDRVAALHLSANQWYQCEELLGEAMTHIIAAQDFERAASCAQRRPYQEHLSQVAVLSSSLGVAPVRPVWRSAAPSCRWPTS